jgi:hypothetical protein
MHKLTAFIFLAAFSASANAVVVDYTTVSDGTYTSVSLGGTTVTGSAEVTSGAFAGFRGLGILGGGGPFSLPGAGTLTLDPTETMSIDFGSIVNAATVTIVDVDPVGNVNFQFEVFNGDTSLGVFTFPLASTAPQTYDLFALSSVSQMSRFTISLAASAPIGLQIQRVSFNVVPIPAAFWLFVSALAALGMSRHDALTPHNQRKQPYQP